MSTVSSYVPALPAGHDQEHGDPKLGWLMVVLLAAAVAVAVGYMAIYLGVQYGLPSWASHAYPPPLAR